MDNSQYVDLILLKAINNAIGFFDQFANVFSFILRHFATGKWLGGDLLRALGDPIHHSLSIGGGVKGDVFVNVCQMLDGISSPIYLHVDNPNLLRTSLTSTTWP